VTAFWVLRAIQDEARTADAGGVDSLTRMPGKSDSSLYTTSHP
jgi:hypothetical protein